MLSDLKIHGILLPLVCSEKFEKMVHDRPNETLSTNKDPQPATGKLESCFFPLTHLVIISEFYLHIKCSVKMFIGEGKNPTILGDINLLVLAICGDNFIVFFFNTKINENAVSALKSL